MILLDTHVWLWWVAEPERLRPRQQTTIAQHEGDVIGVSIISCWEVAKLAQLNKIDLDRPAAEWIALALAYPGVQLLPLTPQIAVESTQLPGEFRSDPADEILVATARLYNCPLVTVDRKLRDYAGVETI